jgi:nucleotide sugar dehydrogenase
MESFQEAIRIIGRRMQPEALVLIETTVPVGACRSTVLPILLEERARRGIYSLPYLAHSYERVMPGPHYVDSIRRYWRVVAGIDEESTMRAREFLASFIDTGAFELRCLEDTTASEMAKLIENSYRATNIAFIHEWTLLAEQTGVNLFEVIDAVRLRKGTHDNIRYPGFGVGGYCLTKDSLLAQWGADHLLDVDVSLKMSLEALRINNAMPMHTLDLLKRFFGGALKNRSLAVCGVSYLPEVADTRNSPTETLVQALFDCEARVKVHDPAVRRWAERPDIQVHGDLGRCLQGVEAVVFAVAHEQYKALSPDALLALTARPVALLDATNVITDENARLLHNRGCRLLGVGKGHWRRRGYEFARPKG